MHLSSNVEVSVLNRDRVVLHLHDGQKAALVMLLARESWLSNPIVHNTDPHPTDVLSLLVMALFLGLSLGAVEEHRMW